MPAAAAPTAIPAFAPTDNSEGDDADTVGEAERKLVAAALVRVVAIVSDVRDAIEEDEVVVLDAGVDDDAKEEDDDDDEEFALMKNPRLLNLPSTKPTGYDDNPDIPLDSRSANFELLSISAASMLSPSPTVHWYSPVFGCSANQRQPTLALSG